MRSFRYNSWRYMLVMFLLIAISFYDISYSETKSKDIPEKQELPQSATPDQTEETEVLNLP